MTQKRGFFSYVIPSILAFALSGVYAIVDGFFIGHSVGDVGLSAINIAYPITAFIQAMGTGIGMGGAVHYSIADAAGKKEQAKSYLAGTMWLLLISGFLVTVLLQFVTSPLLLAMGAEAETYTLGQEYLLVISLGSILQVYGTGLTPVLRNCGSANAAMLSMILGFGTNILLDYLFIWKWGWGMFGAALATVIGQGATLLGEIAFLYRKKQIYWKFSLKNAGRIFGKIVKIGIAPFGLALTPNFSLILINRFSADYGGYEAIAVYACISYVICVAYLIMQGVGDGSQPLISRYYGENRMREAVRIRRMAFAFSLVLSVIFMAILYLVRWKIGGLLGASDLVSREVGRVFPIFLLAIPFVAICRITTASFYATEKSLLSYILTYMEPVAMLVFLLFLPRCFGGQEMVWWSSSLAQILTSLLAMAFLIAAGQKRKMAQAETGHAGTEREETI